MLEPALALYAGDGTLVDEDTLRSALNAGQDPRISHIARTSSDHLYAAVSHNIVEETTGSYTIDVQVTRGGEVPAPRQQIVYLNFAGGEAYNPLTGGTMDFPEFEAGDISSIYDGD
ncbi:MAG: hypothetical protein HGA73_05115, partial [Syntrophaceae bacterium]|nr:hypothetical protein [Syntrophaceae bacterium]